MTKLNPMPTDKLQKLLNDLEAKRPKGRAIAAFDADGTLWDTDLGEQFFQYKIDNKLVPLPDDAFGHYEWLKKNKGNPVAYLWLAQVLKDVPLKQARLWAEEAVAAQPPPIYEEQRAVLKKLKELEVEIYIVTASIKWAVEPGALRLGLTHDDVMGIETEVVDGIITDKQKGLITYREGKASALLDRTGGVRPYFASGNTEGDKWLLECATDLRFVVSSGPVGGTNYDTEQVMLGLAKQNHWYSHRYL